MLRELRVGEGEGGREGGREGEKGGLTMQKAGRRKGEERRMKEEDEGGEGEGMKAKMEKLFTV